MNRSLSARPARILLLALSAAAGSLSTACAHTALDGPGEGGLLSRRDEALAALADEYAVELLRRNPVVSTYLGGSGRYPALADVDGMLRDHSVEALAEEDRWLTSIADRLQGFAPGQLSRARQIDRDVILAQIRFLLHQHEVRRAQERSIDTYNEEPFRGLDFQIQGLTSLPSGKLGTPEEWDRVIARLDAIPQYLRTAEAQILLGIQHGNTPDERMLRSDGLEGATSNAKYLRETFVALADRSMSGTWKVDRLARLGAAAERAAAAYLGWRQALVAQFFDPNGSELVLKAPFRGDRFAVGEAEYDFALENNLHFPSKASEIYAGALPRIEATRAEMTALAQKIASAHGWELPADGPAAVRRVLDHLAAAHPKSDAEMLELYRKAASRLVDFGRKTGMFDVEPNYRLEIVETPGPLDSGPGGAAYYPAPPFKNTGVGRFFVTPSGNDATLLGRIAEDSVAVLSAHEGFPGHDWDYKVMARFRDVIPPARWLTPGAVEDSSSMWQDSMSTEGWALYAEELMAEPRPGAPTGFYTPEERLYQLQSRLFREVRVLVDIGIHTNRMRYDEAVDRMTELFDFLPGACADPAATPDKRASCHETERQMFRYSKWPTQAITYHLGKEAILALREEARARLGGRFSEKAFHLAVMKQGSIPPGYYREEVLEELAGAPPFSAATASGAHAKAKS